LRRFVRNKEREETIALGRKFFDQIVARLPAPLKPDALAAALKRLHLADEAALMTAIARQTIADAAVLDALMPGAGLSAEPRALPMRRAVSIEGLTPGVAYDLATCCHPVPGDRIVGVRMPGETVEVHTIDCATLAEARESDWVDLRWGGESDGATAQLAVIVRNEPGSLAVIAGIFGTHAANILNLALVHRDAAFHTFRVDLEVRDRGQLERILAALRAADAVSSAERVRHDEVPIEEAA
jgi:(p)ppGpp synthase/HD superfamily hydrolase